ncbi:MAG: RsmB/NOP family class I SAM-dependent RNA methyltransferase [Parvularculaceae bacterium]
MRLAGRLAAAIEILADFDARRAPLKTALADWARGARFAGAKDRAWISGLCLDALRRRASLAAAMGEGAPRALALGALRFLWRTPLADLAAAAAETPHGPGALSEAERVALAPGELAVDGPLWARGDFPEWLAPEIERAFGPDAEAEMRAMAVRADVDLRLNTLRADPAKSLQALKTVGGVAHQALATGARIVAPDPGERAPGVTVIPAFNKGWVEVQDAGSQVAALAAGPVKGAQALDYCAGGGGKTLALAALMENAGQLYAYDVDPRRLTPVFHRAKRAGVRNLQIRSPAGGDGLDDLVGKMDVVLVDAPCSGSGTWRRHPDAKWRLTEKHLARRREEQDAVLREAAAYVKPGGALIYVTCSILPSENQDRAEAFLADAPFEPIDPAAGIYATGLVADGALDAARGPSPFALQLTPRRFGSDGFYVAAFQRAA